MTQPSDHNNNTLLASALAEVPRLLSQLNRNPASRTYGSFDRAYWHYRTNDISCARYQEALYALALLYACEFEGNGYYRDEKILEWIRAALRFTAGIQRNDGSFDEWYVHERSYVATAFVAAALAETLLLFREKGVRVAEEDETLALLMRAAGFLTASEEKTVMNQVSGAIFAIAAAGRLGGRGDLVACADALLDGFLASQKEEGWWSEYGGPDIGYLSLTVSYLEKYQRLHGARDVSEALARAKAFVEQFVHPDGSAGGEYMSRNTEYVIPSLALPYLGALRPQHLDDRYLCYILYNWIHTGLHAAVQAMRVPEGARYCKESTLLRVADRTSMLVANGAKGGSLRVYAGGKAYYDSGLEVITPAGSYSTGILDPHNSVAWEEGKLVVSGAVKRIREPLMTTLVAVAFKLWQMTVGRLPFSSRLVKNFLRPRMVSYAGGSGGSFERTIGYTPRSIIITDVVTGEAASHVILFGSKAAYSAVPSSKYAAIPQVARGLLVPHIEEKRTAGEYILRRTFTIPG